MATKEFYIRNASETDARGPFNFEKLLSMAETGAVTPETLYYDANAEKWIAIVDDAELKAQVFPEKKKLTIKKDAKVQTLNVETDSRAPISVHEILAAAEGRTHDTEDKSSHLLMAERCAKAGTYGCVLILLLSMVSEVLPSIDVITQFAPEKLLHSPLLILGALDLVLGVLLLLGLVTLYPFIRFRAMLGLGFTGLLFFLQDRPMELAATAGASAGLYVCTIFLSYVPIGIGLLAGLGGAGALAWIALTR
jgi:hypothetical protein